MGRELSSGKADRCGVGEERNGGEIPGYWVACRPTLSCRRKLWSVFLVRAKEDTVSHSWKMASECRVRDSV